MYKKDRLACPFLFCENVVAGIACLQRSVILSETMDLAATSGKILHFVQNDVVGDDALFNPCEAHHNSPKVYVIVGEPLAAPEPSA